MATTPDAVPTSLAVKVGLRRAGAGLPGRPRLEKVHPGGSVAGARGYSCTRKIERKRGGDHSSGNGGAAANRADTSGDNAAAPSWWASGSGRG